MKAATLICACETCPLEFQSTPPVKAATVQLVKPCKCARISIHAAREGGDAARMPKVRNDEISIHAAREGGDCGFLSAVAVPCHISIHAAREGGDSRASGWVLLPERISIHAAREGGDVAVCPHVQTMRISIHAAREGGDHGFGFAVTPRKRFQSTPPVKAATYLGAIQRH